MEEKRQSVILRKPLFTNNLEQRIGAEEKVKEITELFSKEDVMYDLHIHIDDIEMVPTALMMSLSKRHNVDCHAYIGSFPCNYAVYSFLAASTFTTVNLKG
jgi:hypothetical protein